MCESPNSLTILKYILLRNHGEAKSNKMRCAYDIDMDHLFFGIVYYTSNRSRVALSFYEYRSLHVSLYLHLYLITVYFCMTSLVNT